MGKIQLDHTGSGSGITLSSDGTSLLLDGTAVGGGGASDYTRDTKTANYTVVAGDLGKIIDVTSNSVTITLTAAATLGDGFYVYIRNSSSTATDVVTIDGNGSETIDGLPLLYLRRYEGIHLVCDGSNFFSLRTRVDGLQTNFSLQSHQLDQPTASGNNSLALGYQTKATGNFSTASGYQARATADRSNAFGYGTRSSGTNSVAVGYNANASGSDSVAVGSGNTTNCPKASGSEAVAIGRGANSTASGGFAGPSSYVSGNFCSVALGVCDTTTTYGAQGTSSIALGVQAKTTANRSIAIGYNALSSTADQIALGGTTNQVKISGTYTLPTSDGTNGQVLTTDGSGAVTFADASGGISNVVEDTSPQLGGNLDVQAREINTSTTNGNIVFNPNGTGVVEVKGAGGNDGTLQLNCSANSHGVKIKSPPHSAGASYTLTLPNDDGDASEFLQTNGSGVLTWAAAGASLYSANESSPSAQPSATGANAIAIGDSASATGQDSVAIGDGATAVNNKDFALGISRASGGNATSIQIENNTSSYGASDYLAVAIGKRAKASQGSAVAIGDFVTATGGYAVAIGQASEAVGYNSMALGKGALPNENGKLAYASGWHANFGDAQGGQFILRGATTDATARALTTDGSGIQNYNQVIAKSDTCITFDGTIVAMQNGAQAYASWKIEGLLVNDGGTTTLANSAITVIQNSSNWGLALSADNTNNALAVTCTGEANHNIRWVANIRTSEVTYA